MAGTAKAFSWNNAAVYPLGGELLSAQMQLLLDGLAGQAASRGLFLGAAIACVQLQMPDTLRISLPCCMLKQRLYAVAVGTGVSAAVYIMGRKLLGDPSVSLNRCAAGFSNIHMGHPILDLPHGQVIALPLRIRALSRRR